MTSTPWCTYCSWAIALLAATWGKAHSAETPATAAPNIVFLFADDLGFADLGCYGHPYARTPHLDRLASEGTRFTKFYVTGITCCPSRTGFMTSRSPASFATYPANGGFGDAATITELLHAAGYATGHFGKWHIGPETAPGTYGIDAIDVIGGKQEDSRGRDATIYDAAIQFIESNRDRPFYVNVWGHSTHHAVDPPAAYAERFRDVTVREEDFPEPMRQKFADVRARGGDVDQCMRNYLGDVASLDDSVGRLLARIDELGLRENTIVVFSSDHGSPAIPAADRQKKRKPGRAASERAADRAELELNLLGFNGNLRGGKHGMYEGGVRVPLMIRWPGRVAAGRVDDESITSGLDWLPTLCAMAGVSIDATRFEGEDVSATWFGSSTHHRRGPLLWKTSNPNSEIAVRDAHWKLIAPSRKRGEVELYDLSADPAEQHNVADEHPDVVRTLRNKADAWNAMLPQEYVKTDDRED